VSDHLAIILKQSDCWL